MKQLIHCRLGVFVASMCFAGLLLAGCSPGGKKVAVTDLQCFPPDIKLDSAKARQKIVVEAVYADGVTRDVTGQAKFSIANAELAGITKGMVSPITNGETELHVAFGGRSQIVPVSVSGAAVVPPVSFKLDVMPIFSKAGCNSGACHGTSRGKDGFHLSLFGFDPDGDYFRLTREQIGRRINLAIPTESLIVQKGLGAVQHTGGVRFTTNSDLYATLVNWLNAGAKSDPTNIAKLTGIEIYPKSAVLEGSNTLQHFIVRAQYSDGSERDVTPLAVFISNNDGSAKADPDGTVTTGQRGEAFIQARFGEFNVGAQIIVIPKDLPYQWPTNIVAGNYIDEAVFAKLKKLRLTPSAVCDDSTFLRRASLDITGELPAPAEAEKFLADTDPDRREKLVDELLNRKEFAELWVMKWAELLEIRSDTVVSPKAALVYFEWLRNQMLTGVPLDQMVRNLLTGSGSTLRDPAANYYEMEPDPQKLAENTAQVFLGMRIQCAQCHNHPFDRWTLNDYYGFESFFARVGRKPGDDPRETVVFDTQDGDVKHPVTGAVMRPKFLGGDIPDIKPGETRREVLARWLTSPDNPYFARNIANIVWAHFIGRGIVEPVDDVRISNPPSNPELLDALAAKLVEYHYDFKKLVRDICLSRTYQLDARPNDNNATDDRNFARASIRRLRAEVLLDCISEVTGTQDKFAGLPRGAKAVEIPDGNTADYFLTAFGRASRTTVCSCDVKVDPNLSQALDLLNGDTVENKVEQGGVVKSLLKHGDRPDQVISDLYLRCLSREPTTNEVVSLNRFIKPGAPPEPALNDVFWSLLNAKEFVFNH